LKKTAQGEDRKLQVERYYRRVRKMASLLGAVAPEIAAFNDIS